MATTKIWAIKDSISRVISYAKNPEKTTFSDLKQVLKYAEDDEKTIDKDEKTMYVTGVNCNAKTAYEEMLTVQNRFDKTTGNVAYHAYQSFKTGEVLPELAHKIGVEIAEKMWNKYQVVVATHLKQYGMFEKVKGIIVGYNYDLQKNGDIYPRMEHILLEYTKEYNFPIVKCNDFGHKIINSTIPIGVDIKIDSNNQEIKIIEQFLNEN